MNRGLLSTYFRYNPTQHWLNLPIQHHNNNVVIGVFSTNLIALTECKLYLNLLLTLEVIQNNKI